MGTITHLLLSLCILIKSTLALDFTYTTFPEGSLLLSGAATINSGAIILTNSTASFAVGRALHPSPLLFRPSFSTSFVFSITPPQKPSLPGHGMAFVVVPAARGTQGASPAQHLGLTNSRNDGDPKNHLFAVEFDVFQNQELNDIDYNHVGVDVNSVKSLVANEAGYWGDDDESFVKLKLNNGDKYRAWIEYVAVGGGRLTVTMAPVKAERPRRPLIGVDVDLSSSVFLDEMYVGFVAATGNLVETHEIHSWSLGSYKKMEMYK